MTSSRSLKSLRPDFSPDSSKEPVGVELARYDTTRILGPDLRYSIELEHDTGIAARALRTQIGRYVAQHRQYRRARRRWGFASLAPFLAPVALALFFLQWKLDEQMSQAEVFQRWAFGILVLFIVAVALRINLALARRALQHRKAEIGWIGCWVNVERSEPFEPILVITSDGPSAATEADVVGFGALELIDFRRYDRAFDWFV